MPFISKNKLEEIRTKDTTDGFDIGYKQGREMGRSLERIAQNIKANTIKADTLLGKPYETAKPAESSISDDDFRDLLRLVPGLEQYSDSRMFGIPYLDRGKLAADIRDLDAAQSVERGRKIILTLAGDTIAYTAEASKGEAN